MERKKCYIDMHTNKIKNLFLLALMVASTVVGAISFPNTAMAAPPGVYVSPAVKKDATASALRTALALCLTINNGGHMSGDPPYQASAGDIASGNWFAEGGEPQSRVGYIVDNDNGRVQCGNLFDDRNVAGALGWDSNIAMACGLGMKRTNGSNCINGSGDLTKDPIGKDKNKVYAAIDKKYNNATGGNGYNAAQDYLLAAVTYKEACDAKAIVTVKDANADQKNKGYDKVKVVNSKGETVEVYYEKGNNDKHAWKNNNDNFNYYEENCNYMKDQMNKNAAAYAAFVKEHPPAAGEDTSSDDGEAAEDGEKTSCQVDGIGWIVCPVMRFLSRAVDGAYATVAYFLTVPAVATATDGNPLYDAWSIMRNIANVAFVIMFLAIIYSQLTSVGISNYGVKKLLPKLIIAAILVNVSYWICAIAVDLSNISGTSLKGMLDSISKSLYVTGGSAAETGGGGLWDGITVGLLTGGAIGIGLYVGLSALLPLIVTAAFAIVMVLLVLTLRQALIVILIVVSPLAFVAFLLPNTESLFKKWKDIFMTLLLMFPIIALIFGGSSLANTVITGVASDKEAEGTWFLSLMGAAVTIVPLFITPFLIKATSGLAGRWGGMINNPNKGPFDRLRKKAEGYRDYRQDVNRGNRLGRGSGILEGEGGALGGKYSRRRRAAAYLRSAGATSEVNTAQKRGFAKAVADESAQEYFAKRALNQEGFAQQIAGNEAKARGLEASAQSAVDKIFKQDVANREILLTADVRFKNNPQAALDEALESGDKVQAAAATSMLMKTGASGYNAIYDSLNAAEKSGTANAGAMNTMRDFIKENGKDFKAKDPAMLRWATQQTHDTDGNALPQRTLEQASAEASYVQKSDAEVAGFAPKAFERAAAAGAISQEQAKSILGNQNIVKDTSPQNLAALKNIAQGLPTNAPPAPTTAPTNAPTPTPAPAAPSPQRVTAPYSRADLQSMGPQNLQMVINSAGGAANLSDGDIAKIINATRGQVGAEGIHNAMKAERDTRRGTLGPTPPGGPTPPPTPPTPPAGP